MLGMRTIRVPAKRVQSHCLETSVSSQGREGRTMFFRVGEEPDHPAQEGDDGGLAPELQAEARFPLKDRVLLEGIVVT